MGDTEQEARRSTPGAPTTSERADLFRWLLERAEDVAAEGLSEGDAHEAVRCGYSSIEADRMAREDP